MIAPVALFIYNRPQTTRRVIAALLEARPAKLFVFAAGPRTAQDEGRCVTARADADGAGWQCEVVKEYSEAHLGLRRRVVSGIDRVLAQHEAAIIREDDTVPAPSFLRFCGELLQRYRDDERLMTVAGTNSLLRWRAEAQSYLFASHSMNCGWATWRRAWQHYDDSMRQWAAPATRARLRAALPGNRTYNRFASFYGRVYQRRVGAWDCAWSLASLLRGGLAAVPAVNLVSNIGFGAGATHTRQPLAVSANMPTAALPFPLRHPERVEVDSAYQRLYMRWLGGDPDLLIVLQYAEHALAAVQPLRAMLLISAMCQAAPELVDDPAVGALQAAARHAVESSRHAAS